MRAVIQRVSSASVSVDNNIIGAIQQGLLILVGIAPEDTQILLKQMAEKIVHLRIFADQDGRFDRSLLDIGGAALLVSQFTLFGDLRRGRRPGFSAAAPPEQAAPLVDFFAQTIASYGISVAQGRFGAHMQVALVNDGPVTIVLDSAIFNEPRRGS